MRRFASVFSSKRDKHNHDKPASTVPANPISDPPHLTDQAHSSASSSSGSASLCPQTPEDDHNQLVIMSKQPSSKKSWMSWLKPGTLKQHKSWERPSVQVVNPQQDDSDEPPDFQYEQPEVYHPQSLSQNSLSQHSLPTPSPAQTRENLIVLTKNSLVSVQAPTPFSQLSHSPFTYPRSCNRRHHLPRQNTFQSAMLKTRILKRLQDPNLVLTPAEQLSIDHLATWRVSSVTTPRPLDSPFDEPYPSKATTVFSSSRGLQRWVSRPCFEDRNVVFVPSDDGAIFPQRIIGPSLAVAALEYSEFIDAMIGLELADHAPAAPHTTLAIDIPPTSEYIPQAVLAPSSPSSSTSSLPSSPGHSRPPPYITAPSPLRNEHSPVISPVIVPTVTDPPVKRGVRFAEDDKEDGVPLGYVLRMKKNREQKAKFLRMENERRAMEERARIEDERRRVAAERAELEQDRRTWEKEKIAMEEKKHRYYTEEVVAARLRRESQRAGGVPSTINHSGLTGPFPSSPSLFAREVERNRSRPPDSRRQSRVGPEFTSSSTSLTSFSRKDASDGALPTLQVPFGSSPPLSSSSRGSSRPPSAYSGQSSSDDVRHHRGPPSNGYKRNSVATGSSSSLRQSVIGAERAMSFPAWSGSNSSLNMIPPVPTVPTMIPAFVMMDMPLLPPTPPFMLQDYSRHHGQTSSGSSGSSSPNRGRLSSSANSSRERVSVASPSSQHPRSSSSSSYPERPEYRHSASLPASRSAQARSGHDKHPSGDSRRSSLPAPQNNAQQYQRQRMNSQHARDRPLPTRTQSAAAPLPTSPLQHQRRSEPLSPWTGLPSQNGRLPNGMATPQMPSNVGSDTSATRGRGRRQTVVI